MRLDDRAFKSWGIATIFRVWGKSGSINEFGDYEPHSPPPHQEGYLSICLPSISHNVHPNNQSGNSNDSCANRRVGTNLPHILNRNSV